MKKKQVIKSFGVAMCLVQALSGQPEGGLRVELVSEYSGSTGYDGLLVERDAVEALEVGIGYDIVEGPAVYSLEIGYGIERSDWSGGALYGDVDMWELGLGYVRRLDNGWSAIGSIGVESAWAESGYGAKPGAMDGLDWQIGLGGLYAVNERLSIGIVGFYSTGIAGEDDEVLVLPGLRWQVNERLSIQSREGLEAEYKVSDTSAVQVGVAWKDREMLLAEGPGGNVVYEEEFMRLGVAYVHTLRSGLEIRPYVFGDVLREVEIVQAGVGLLDTDMDESFGFGVSLGYRF